MFDAHHPKIKFARLGIFLGVLFIALGTQLTPQWSGPATIVGAVAALLSLEIFVIDFVINGRLRNPTKVGITEAASHTKGKGEYFIAANPQSVIIDVATTFPLLAAYVGMLFVSLVIIFSEGQALISGKLPLKIACFSVALFFFWLVVTFGRAFFRNVSAASTLMRAKDKAMRLAPEGWQILWPLVDEKKSKRNFKYDAQGFVQIEWSRITKLELRHPVISRSCTLAPARYQLWCVGEEHPIVLHRSMVIAHEEKLLSAFRNFSTAEVFLGS